MTEWCHIKVLETRLVMSIVRRRWLLCGLLAAFGVVSSVREACWSLFGP